MSIDLKAELDEKIIGWGASIWGVANLAPHQESLWQEYDHSWDDYPRAISIGVYFPKQVLNQIETGPTLTYQAYYDIVNALLNEIALKTTLLLEAKGHRAFPVPASQRQGKYKQTAIFSHRLAGNLAGLGWIGKNLSLVNLEVGPRMRLVTVLTNAPLPPNQPQTNQCPSSCTKCQSICPVQALKGKTYQPNQPIEDRFDYQGCANFLHQVKQSFGKEICGRCLAVCPWGK